MIKKYFDLAKKNVFNAVVISALISGLGSAISIYYLQKKDNKNNWCIQEIKNFDINSYNKKDVLILSKECKDQIKEYKLLSNVLFEGNDTKKIASVINQLYIDNDIDTAFISDQRDSIAESVEKNSEHSNDFYNENAHYQSAPDKMLSTYLVFLNELSIKTLPYEFTDDTQINFYYKIFLNFFHNSQWLFNINHSAIDESDPKSFEPLKTDEFINFQKLVRNIGKNHNIVIEGNSDKFNNALSILFNSYLSKNRKSELINELKTFTELLKNQMSNHQAQHGMYINTKIFYSDTLITLILDELNSYNLSETDLKEIFGLYTNLIQYYRPPWSFEIQSKLFYDLYSRNNSVFNNLIFYNHQNANIKLLLNDNLLKYIALHNNCDLLKNLLNDNAIKDDVISAIITGSKKDDLWNANDCTDLLLKLLEDEKKFSHKKDLMSRAAINANYRIAAYILEYMRENKTLFIQDLNSVDLSTNNQFYGSLYLSLANTKVDQYPAIQKEKLNLYISLFEKTKNKNNKDLIFNIIQNFLSKNDNYTSNKISEMVENTKDKHYKQSFLIQQNKFN